MQTNKDSGNSYGGVVISSEVISSIAMNAAKDIDGVAGFSSNYVQIKGMLNKMSGKSSSVIVSNENADLAVNICIKVKSGYNVRNVAVNVQNAVKQSIQNMTGNVVATVNVIIADLVVEETEKQ